MLDIITDYPLWLVLLWLPISIGLAFWLYRPTKAWLKELAKWKRFVMLSLRALSLFLIGLLLLGILFETLNVRKEKPLLLNLIDNSSSMLNYADSADVKSELPDYLNKINEELTRFDVKNIFLDDSLVNKEGYIDFKAAKTNLYRLLDDTYENYYGRNIGAIHLVSDGNFNAGGNPLTLSERFSKIPLYTIGVGDTIRKKDLLVRSVLHNEIAFLGNTFPVEVTVEGDLVKELKTNVKILRNEKVVSTKEILFSSDDFSQQKLEFMLTADAVGFQEYKVVIESIEGESNYENNERTFYVEVIDSRSKILILAGGLHPDLGAIKSVLASDQNLEIETFRISEFNGELTPYDLIIWHEPGTNTPPAFLEKIKKSSKPIWYIVGTRSTNETINQLPVPLIARFSKQQDNISATHNKSFGKFELSEDTKRALNRFPPLISPYGKLEINGPIDVLFQQRLGNIAKEEPLFFFGSSNQAKYAVLQAEGLWRWKLANYQLDNNNDAFNEIIKKTVQYLSVRTNTSKLRINLPVAFFDDETVTVNATFYNDSYEPIVDPLIKFELTNKEGDEQKYEFLPSRSEYSLYLGNLDAGKYEWRAFTEYEGKKYEKTGAFVVRKLELEALDSRANHNLLYQLAQIGDRGAFYLFSDRANFINDLNERSDITSIGYESFSFKNLIDYKWIFFLVVILFAIEWFMRRYNGSY
jgi:hypothetical protein